MWDYQACIFGNLHHRIFQEVLHWSHGDIKTKLILCCTVNELILLDGWRWTECNANFKWAFMYFSIRTKQFSRAWNNYQHQDQDEDISWIDEHHHASAKDIKKKLNKHSSYFTWQQNKWLKWKGTTKEKMIQHPEHR